MAQEKMHLEELGYTVLENIESGRWSQYRVLAPKCGHEFSPDYGNVIKQLLLTGKTPCRRCGSLERIQKAQAEFKRKYGRDDLQVWEDYNITVRRLTEATYKKHKSIINPMNYRRTNLGWHLDHRVPVSVCFDHQIAPERAASVDNLAMLPALSNMQKSKFTYDSVVLEQLRY
jgi:hypothetical protein